MNCIVTAGPTYESLDGVRRLTNFSTGRLGSELANYLVAQGHKVVLLKGYYAVYQGATHAQQTFTFTTTADLQQRLQRHSAETIHAVFHAAAVSDFTFGKVFKHSAAGALVEVQSGKFSTREGPLLAELVPTPKLIDHLRDWFPQAQLVGWKFEVDGTRADALTAGEAQLRRCQTNACVVNGPAYGEGFGLLISGLSSVHLPTASRLFEALARLLLPA